MSIDKLSFLIGGLFLMLFFFIERKEKKISRYFFIVAIVVLFAPLYLPRKIFGKWNSLEPLGGKVIKKIILAPSQPEWNVNLTDSSVTILNKTEIDKISNLLKETEVFYPNHPLRVWETSMIFIAEDNDSLILKIEKTENNGVVIFSQNKKYRKDELAKYLENLTMFTSPHRARMKP